MSSPFSCSGCGKTLQVQSTGGLCPDCLRTSGADLLTSTAAGHPGSTPAASEFTRSAAPRPDAATLAAGLAVEDAEPRLPPAPPGYELVGRLGAGGMGAVYLARDSVAERTVAMKFLHAPGSAGAFNRFKAEVRALAKLDHPNIVRVLASDFLRPDPFFTMEHLGGGTLTSRVERDGPLGPEAAARLMVVVSRAVQAAHQAGVVHRDLKPTNILLAEDGTPKVTDFGLAKRLDREDGLTVAGGAMGTPGYMAPEQSSSGPGEIGPATDVYGLGGTLYFLLTGRRPRKHSRDDTPPAPPRALNPAVPVALEAVVLKCLEPRPADRYASAGDLVADLERYLAGEAPLAPPLTGARRLTRWARRNRRALAGGALGAVVLAGVFALGAAVWGPAGPPAPGEAPGREAAVAAARLDLAADKPIELVPDAGLPKYYRCVLEVNPPARSSLGDVGCEFKAFTVSLLELFPAPGVDHYRVTVDLRQLATGAGTSGADEFVGFYLGHASATGGNETTAHAMLAVTYSEKLVGGLPAGKNPVSFGRLGFYQSPRFALTQTLIRGEQLAFENKPVPPGPWRRVVAEVSPAGVRIDWRATADGKVERLADWDLTKCQTEYDKLATELNGYAPAVKDRLPAWAGDMAFGVICSKSSVAVRNAVLTPLP